MGSANIAGDDREMYRSDGWVGSRGSRGGTIPEIMMRYVSRYLGHDTIRITILH